MAQGDGYGKRVLEKTINLARQARDKHMKSWKLRNKAISAGFNAQRHHMKVEPRRWYYHADRLGLMVWQDMPTASGYNGAFI
jgi:hypothetical protein